MKRLITKLLFGGCLLLLAACGSKKQAKAVRPEVSINGQKVWVGMTVRELVQEGFSVGLTAYEGDILDLAVQPQVPGETHSPRHYHVYKDDEFMLVDFSVCNTNESSCEFIDSKIYTVHFNPFLDADDGVELLVNGIDVGVMKREETLSALEKLGVTFVKENKEDYLSGKSGFIIGTSGEYSFELQTFDSHETIDSIRVRMKVR